MQYNVRDCEYNVRYSSSSKTLESIKTVIRDFHGLLSRLAKSILRLSERPRIFDIRHSRCNQLRFKTRNNCKCSVFMTYRLGTAIV